MFTGISLGSHPAAGRARAGHHLRPDGRHQHGARRTDHGRRLRHLRGAEPVPRATCRACSTGICWRRCRSPSSPRRWSAWCWSAAVIRFLYGRPLETLLATWGISLILIQAVRTIFGAQNVQVENPAWMSGGVEIMRQRRAALEPHRDHRLRRCGAAAGRGCCSTRTRLGLFVRGGHPEPRAWRAASACRPARVDTLRLRPGLGHRRARPAARCRRSATSGPDLGQSYIVDSFMVVVLGGVGQLAGTVYAALGLGVRQQVPRRPGRARCWPRSWCWCSSSSSSRSGRRACSPSRAAWRRA